MRIEKELKPLFGRENELKQLESVYKTAGSQIAVVYGRRRVGKSFLIQHFCENKLNFQFDGLEKGDTQVQLDHVADQLYVRTKNPLLRSFNPKTWQDFFNTLIEVIQTQKSDKKIVLVFDEIQWLAAKRSTLIAILKSYWDNKFIKSNVMIILCGSMAHYVVKKVIRSKSLYGRINAQILIQNLTPQNARKMLAKRGDFEALQYLMIFGGIPRYLEEINSSQSFDQNIQRLLYTKGSFFEEEIDKVFFSQFKESKNYSKIVRELGVENLTLDEIARKVKISSGGGLKEYLLNLELAQFVRANQLLLNSSKKNIKYKLVDEYIRFYYQFIQKYEKRISEGYSDNIFLEQIKVQWNPWLGFAFENFCLKNALYIANRAGFSDKVLKWGSYIQKSNLDKEKNRVGVQIDLLYERTDLVITICEIKFSKEPIDVPVIREMESKLSRIQFKENITIEKMLITAGGATKALMKTDYFHYIITLKELF
jgi:AAA+ ATPase superfamily predicted ATPase